MEDSARRGFSRRHLVHSRVETISEYTFLLAGSLNFRRKTAVHPCLRSLKLIVLSSTAPHSVEPHLEQLFRIWYRLVTSPQYIPCNCRRVPFRRKHPLPTVPSPWRVTSRPRFRSWPISLLFIVLLLRTFSLLRLARKTKALPHFNIAAPSGRTDRLGTAPSAGPPPPEKSGPGTILRLAAHRSRSQRGPSVDHTCRRRNCHVTVVRFTRERLDYSSGIRQDGDREFEMAAPFPMSKLTAGTERWWVGALAGGAIDFYRKHTFHSHKAQTITNKNITRKSKHVQSSSKPTTRYSVLIKLSSINDKNCYKQYPKTHLSWILR